jgi:cytochrome c oxidase assembly protein subunit 15
MGTLLLQLSYGGLVAGLKAGHVSDTWPLMFGQLVPDGLLSTYEPWWRNLYEALGSHWIHRWFAFVVAGVAVALYMRIRSDRPDGYAPQAASWMLAAVGSQIALGVLVVLLGVPKWFAIAHQGLGIVLFCILLVIAHQAHNDKAPVERALAEAS